MSNLRIKLWKELNEAIDALGKPECHDNPDIFDPELYVDYGTRRYTEIAAKEICGRCPAIRACAAYALAAGEPSNIWGGLTPAEREALVRKA